MTSALQLAQAVLTAQMRLEELTVQAQQSLSRQREELRHLASLPADANLLEAHIKTLKQEQETLNREIAGQEASLSRMQAAYQQELNQAWQRLQEQYLAQNQKQRQARVGLAYQSALEAFGDELKRAKIDIEHATPAQLQQQLTRLQDSASKVREQANLLLRQARAEIEKNAELHAKQIAIEEQRTTLRHQREELRKRLLRHNVTESSQLFADIFHAEAGTLRQLRRDVLEPLIQEAHEERQLGFAGDDPLEALQTLYDV